MFESLLAQLAKRTSSWATLLEQLQTPSAALAGRPSSRSNGDDVTTRSTAAWIVQEGLSLVVFLQTWFVANEGRSSLCTPSILREVLGPFHQRVFAALAQRGVFQRPAEGDDALEPPPQDIPEARALRDVSAVAFLVLATALEVETFDGLTLAQDFLFEHQVYVEELSRTFSDRLLALANSGLNVSVSASSAPTLAAAEAHRTSGIRPSYHGGGGSSALSALLGGSASGSEPCGAGGLHERIAGLSLVTTTSVLWSLLRPTKTRETLVGPFKLFLQRRFEKLFNERSVIMYIRMHVAYLRQQPRLRVRDERSEFASPAEEEELQEQVVEFLWDRQLTAVCFGVGSFLSSRLLTALCHQINVPEEVQRWTLTVEQELIVKRICHEGPPAVSEARAQLQSAAAASVPLGAAQPRREGARSIPSSASPTWCKRALEALVGSTWMLHVYAAAMPELLVLASEVHDDALEMFSNGVSNLAEQLRSACLTERLVTPLLGGNSTRSRDCSVKASRFSSAIVLLSWATGWWMQSHIARAHSMPVTEEHAAVWHRELDALERPSQSGELPSAVPQTSTTARNSVSHSGAARRTMQLHHDAVAQPRRSVGSPIAVDDTPQEVDNNHDEDDDRTQQQQHQPRPTLGNGGNAASVRLSTAHVRPTANAANERRVVSLAEGDVSSTLRSFAEWMQHAGPLLLDAAAEHDAHVEHQLAMQRALETSERRSTLLDGELRTVKAELLSVRNQLMEESSAHAAQVAALAEELRCERESSHAQQQRIRLLERQLKRFEQMSAVIRSMTSEVTSSASLSTDD